MAITAPPTLGSTPPSAPIGERFDRTTADRKSGGTDRPGFDLGGADGQDVSKGDGVLRPGSTAIPGGSADPVPGGTAAGSRSGEATQPTAGAVRPPRSTHADQTSTQGNPDNAS